MWSDVDDSIIGGDLTAAIGYVTPARGVVVTPVAPIGLRDRSAGTIGFTTSLGFGRKLDRLRENPQIAVAYHAREHGFAEDPRYVLVQGRASYDVSPDAATLTGLVGPASTRFLGAPRTGRFWDRWLSAYYADRVVVTVDVERVLSWPDLECAGELSVAGKPPPAGDPPAQGAPKQGTAPRIDISQASRRLGRLPHLLVGYVGSDGFPMIMPVRLGNASAAGIELSGPLPEGSRRAGLMGHRYEPKLIGLETRQYTGWLEQRVYAPHTQSGFRAPANKTLLLLANGYLARRGLKRAKALGRA